MKRHPDRRKPRSLLWACVLALGAIATPVAAQQVLDIHRYRLTFDEPFDRLDASAWGPGTRWIAHTPWNGDFGAAAFLDPGRDGPFAIKGGILSITMTRKAGRLGSGLLSAMSRDRTGFSQSGGYFEARMRLPAGSGVWPAFWLASMGLNGEDTPEIDVIEYYGHADDNYMATTHVWHDGKTTAGQAVQVRVPPRSLEEKYHLYGVSIDATNVIFYLDRKEVAREPSRPEYLKPVFPIVNLAAGGGWPIDGLPATSILQVDYVRAYLPR